MCDMVTCQFVAQHFRHGAGTASPPAVWPETPLFQKLKTGTRTFQLGEVGGIMKKVGLTGWLTPLCYFLLTDWGRTVSGTVQVVRGLVFNFHGKNRRKNSALSFRDFRCGNWKQSFSWHDRARKDCTFWTSFIDGCLRCYYSTVCHRQVRLYYTTVEDILYLIFLN